METESLTNVTVEDLDLDFNNEMESDNFFTTQNIIIGGVVLGGIALASFLYKNREKITNKIKSLTAKKEETEEA